ncbi:hypothetical protein [Mixta mediterraneensis]|uniref:hypothetical protein n=1 Tax=Mixta mediterraneensis TaxID=2758443 RepID=UPI001876D5B5|nr:hypothetical protein [Mixta mediterraneensis]MBE5252517.1 hypothetical protein [Mixta mediterraneensis]
MKRLKAWFEAWLTAGMLTTAESEQDNEWLLSLSQLYGVEHYPALHRYHEK